MQTQVDEKNNGIMIGFYIGPKSVQQPVWFEAVPHPVQLFKVHIKQREVLELKVLFELVGFSNNELPISPTIWKLRKHVATILRKNKTEVSITLQHESFTKYAIVSRFT